MNKKQIILIAATATGLYLVLRGLKKNSPTVLSEEFKNAIGDKKPFKSAYNNYIGSQGQATYFNAHGDMSLANLVKGYKRP